jgi:hypothetical protein
MHFQILQTNISKGCLTSYNVFMDAGTEAQNAQKQ